MQINNLKSNHWLIKNITDVIAPVLNCCQDADISGFRRPLDRKVTAIKDIRGKESDLGQHNFAIILADEYGKRIGKYVAIGCPLESLESEIISLLQYLDQVESM